jgi:NAD(P)-dependent dehydrogenase (short-subunit alcohol dehydrogenase family)
MKRLKGKIAIVAGATRGAGRGIARMLGEAGATVYCTGRTSRDQPNTSDHHYAGRPETIEETAELVSEAGGTGIPVRVDHNIEAEVVAFFERVKRERKRLDVLVNVLTGQPVTTWAPFWKLAPAEGRSMLDGWIWSHVLTCRSAVPLFLERKGGLLVEIVEGESIGYHGQFYFDLSETCLKRIVYSLAEELAPHGVAAVGITPGFMRTEAILERFGVTESNWREAALNNAQAKRFGFIDSETPCFVGRAVASLAADPKVGLRTGGVYSSWSLSQTYGFTDLDGSQPNIWPAAHARYAELTTARAAFRWQLEAAPDRES